MTVPPTQVVLACGTGATIIPSVGEPGRLSVTDALINGALFVFRNVIVKVEIPPGLTLGGVKFLLMEKALTIWTVKLALMGLGIDWFWSLVISPGMIVFVCTPATLLVTYTLIWHVVPAGIVPFDNVIVVAPVTAVRVEEEPQLFVIAG